MALPDAMMVEVLERHQVTSLATSGQDGPWAASVFYAYDPDAVSLLFLSAHETRHAQILVANPEVAGTVAGQFTDIAQIHGLQYRGRCRALEEPVQVERALELYYRRYPQARALRAPVWELRLVQIKLTDNRLGFGSKWLWQRAAAG